MILTFRDIFSLDLFHRYCFCLFFDFICLLLIKYFVLFSILNSKLRFLLWKGLCCFLLINNTFNRFYLIRYWINFKCLGLYFMFLKANRLVFIMRDLWRPVYLRFRISSCKFWFFFLFRVEFWDQFTEKLCVFMNHHSLRVFMMTSYLRVIFILIKRLSSHRMVVICTISGVFLVVISNHVCRIFLSEKSICWWISCLIAYEFYWTLASIIFIVTSCSKRWYIASSWGSTSHGRETWWQIRIFPFKTNGWLVPMILIVWDIVIFPLNKKKITLNITVCLLLNFNGSFKIKRQNWHFIKIKYFISSK